MKILLNKINERRLIYRLSKPTGRYGQKSNSRVIFNPKAKFSKNIRNTKQKINYLKI